jgi:hypothetical protein
MQKTTDEARKQVNCRFSILFPDKNLAFLVYIIARFQKKKTYEYIGL